jgi:uracil-DNA glycosylase
MRSVQPARRQTRDPIRYDRGSGLPSNALPSDIERMKPPPANPFVPETHDLKKLRAAAAACEGCELFRNATQTVFGEGPSDARLMFVGETAGDQEDLAGRPFVGAAGRLLDEALTEVGIERNTTYVTNIVKHFKWTPRGKRRLHSKPSSREIAACFPWLEAEIESVGPELIVCLGATAAQGLLGRDFRITRQRGQILQSPKAEHVLATYHPAAILRAPDDESRRAMRSDFISDLKVAADWLRKPARRD